MHHSSPLDFSDLHIEFVGDIFQSQKIGGVSRYFCELVSRCKAEYHVNVHLRMFAHCNEYFHKAQHLVESRSLYIKNPNEYLFSRLAPRADLLLKRLTRSRADLLHGSCTNFATLRTFRGIRVSTFYDMIHERLDWAPRIIEQKAKTFNESDHCIAISHATKQDMIRHYGCEESKISVIHLASDFELLAPKQPSDPPPTGKYLLWVGGRDRYKNFRGFVEAVPHSILQSRKDVQLVFTGRQLSSEELSLLASVGIAPDRCRSYLVTDSELAWLYRNACALLFISTLEGFGLPPLEAMSCRCPVIASNVSSIPEVTGTAAANASPDSPEEIAAQIDRVLDDPQFRTDLIEAGIRQASIFSWDRMTRETLSLYRKLYR